MSDSKMPPRSRLWGFALSLAACVAAVWILVKLIESSWGWLLVIGGIVALATIGVFLVRWWWHRNEL